MIIYKSAYKQSAFEMLKGVKVDLSYRKMLSHFSQGHPLIENEWIRG